MSADLSSTIHERGAVTVNGSLAIGNAHPAASGLRNAFLISQCAMVVLAGLIFAAAEGGPIPAAACVMAPFAFYTVDRQRWFSLPIFWAGLLGVVGMLAAVIEFFSGDIESRLLSGGHFMCYLTWIVLWQRKGWREYWMLAALSILQVAVGSLLTNSHWLGVGLVAYIVVTLWTLTVFTMYRMEAVTEESHARRLRDLKSSLWFSIDPPAVSRPLVAANDRATTINVRFIGISLAVIAASLMFALVAFLLVPRVWVGQFQIFDNSPLPGTQGLTGFTDEVRLGDLGQILESSDPVMDVEFFDNLTGRKLTLSEAFGIQRTGEPLFRGVVLQKYENGSWTSGGSSFSIVSRRTGPRDFLRQEIKLFPIGSPTVFAVGDPNACIAREPIEDIHLSPSERVFARGDNANLQVPLRYFALSRAEDSVSGLPPRASWAVGSQPVTLEVPESLTELVEYTNEILSRADGLNTQFEIAEYLNNHLRDSDEFSYTLSLAVSNPSADPIYDFVFNRKSGHCEYFAAALTMMLRSVDIHARIVSGFKGGAADTANNVLKVQQLHAHAWVEAWIDDHWVQLDPTPAARTNVVNRIQAGGLWKRWINRVQNLWNNGLTWSKDDQEELIYDPVRSSFQTTRVWLQSPATGFQVFMNTFRSFASDPSRWFSWQGGLAFAVIALLLVGVWKFIRFLMALITGRHKHAAAANAAGVTVAFYARFESLAQQLKLWRAASDTAREFAAKVRERFERMPDAAIWPKEFPARIADSFYSVRFGGVDIDESAARAINRELDVLEEQINRFEAAQRKAK